MTSPDAGRRVGSTSRLPTSDPRFWLVQALVGVIAAGHFTLEMGGSLLGWPSLYLVPVSAFFIPSIYASLIFGVRGAVATVAWCWVLSLPSLVLFHTGWQRVGVSIQLAIMLLMAVVVGRSVDRERRARDEAVASRHALKTYVRLAADAQEEERKRVARELHDETIQDLVIARGDLAAVAAAAGSDRERLAAAVGTVDTAIFELRRLCRDLRPSVLDDLGLTQALDALTRELSNRTGIDVTLTSEGPEGRLGPRAELVLYRIAQEALRNVERHSGAGHAWVELLVEPAAVVLRVRDDGRGLDEREIDAPSDGSTGLGLLGMRERAGFVNGTLSISSRPGRGALVEVTVPLT